MNPHTEDGQPEPTLYGLERTNRKNAALWGKNQFNSAFPASLCCYMRDQGVCPVYLQKAGKSVSAQDSLPFDRIFLADSEHISFGFEEVFKPYEKLIGNGKLKGMDLVVSASGKQVQPFEIKLTVLPDHYTHGGGEDKWGCELVIRPISVLYAILGIATTITEKSKVAARGLVETVGAEIQHWDNLTEIFHKKERITGVLQEYLMTYQRFQAPFLIQPVWKTEGKKPTLQEDCFDVFVWSDFMLCQAIVDAATEAEQSAGKITRALREVVRMLFCLHSIHTTRKIDLKKAMDLSLGNQTDKAVAFNGQKTRRYMAHGRLVKLCMKRDVLKDIILHGGERSLSPERRFDATIYFTRALAM